MTITFIPSPDQYYSVESLSGFTPGTSLIITNHTADPIFVLQQATQPAATAEGFPVESGSSCSVNSGDVPLWVRGFGGPLVFQDPTSVILPAETMNPRVLVGLEAFTVQSFTEANCKNGTQYEVSTFSTDFAAGQTRDFIAITGNKPVLIKNREFTFSGGDISTAIYRAPTYTGGTPVAYYNLSDINPVPGTVVLLSGATVTSPGTQISPTYTLLGTIPQGGQAITPTSAENSLAGMERVLRPNTTYLLRTTNISAATIKIATKSTWYEGHLSSLAF